MCSRYFVLFTIAVGLCFVAERQTIAQEARDSSPVKVAYIDSYAFHSTGGIKKLIEAIESMGYVDCIVANRRSTITSKVEDLKKEIAELECKKLDTSERYAELLKMNRDLETADEENLTCMKAILKEKTDPIYKEIRAKTLEFAKLKGLEIFVGSRSDRGMPLFATASFEDLTAEFIAYFNRTTNSTVSH